MGFGVRDREYVDGPPEPHEDEKPPAPKCMCPHCGQVLDESGEGPDHERLGDVRFNRTQGINILMCQVTEQIYSLFEAELTAEMVVKGDPSVCAYGGSPPTEE